MAFPSVVARTNSEQTSDADGFTVGLGGPSAGELIVSIVSVDYTNIGGADYLKWQVDEVVSGKNWWIAGKVLSNNAVVALVAIQVAAGGDALRLMFPDGSPQQASAITFRISGHGSYASVASAIGNSTNGDPPNVAITGSAQDCLFIAALCTDAQVIASAAPSSYGNLTTKTATNAAGASVSVADRNLNATSDNPGTFTSATEQWVAFSIAIPENNITTNARATQAPVEALSQVSANARTTQLAMEAVTSNSLHMVVTQAVLETVTPQTQSLYVTQVVLEVLSGDPAVSNANKYRQIQIAC
jgi:hypothetical protein